MRRFQRMAEKPNVSEMTKVFCTKQSVSIPIIKKNIGDANLLVVRKSNARPKPLLLAMILLEHLMNIFMILQQTHGNKCLDFISCLFTFGEKWFHEFFAQLFFCQFALCKEIKCKAKSFTIGNGIVRTSHEHYHDRPNPCLDFVSCLFTPFGGFKGQK